MTEELVTYKGIQQVSKYTQDNESKASHGEGSYIHRKGKARNKFYDQIRARLFDFKLMAYNICIYDLKYMFVHLRVRNCVGWIHIYVSQLYH